MQLQEVKKIQEVYANLAVALGREPTQEEIEIELGKPIDKDANLQAILEYEEKPADEFEIGMRLSMHNHELRKRRKEKGLRQRDLAEKLGMTRMRVSAIETFRAQPYSSESKKIADFFAVPEDVLFPEWTMIITEGIKNARLTKVVPVKQLRLESSEIQMLESGEGHEYMMHNTDNELLRVQIDQVLDDLTPKEQAIVRMRAGLNDEGKALSLEEIGQEFGVTGQRIRQIENKAYAKIRHHPRGEILKTFNDKTI